MDLKSSYWQIEVYERDGENASFVTPDGLCEFEAMPFRLCTTPATFQRVTNTLLTGLDASLVYLDDVSRPTSTSTCDAFRSFLKQSGTPGSLSSRQIAGSPTAN